MRDSRTSVCGLREFSEFGEAGGRVTYKTDMGMVTAEGLLG